MENQVKVFESAEFGSVRTVEVKGTPYFVGKDVATILAYANPQKAIRDHVDDEDKTVNELFTVNGTQGILINESGLYSLILGSKLPNAKKYSQNWYIYNTSNKIIWKKVNICWRGCKSY